MKLSIIALFIIFTSSIVTSLAQTKTTANKIINPFTSGQTTISHLLQVDVDNVDINVQQSIDTSDTSDVDQERRIEKSKKPPSQEPGRENFKKELFKKFIKDYYSRRYCLFILQGPIYPVPFFIESCIFRLIIILARRS